MDKIVYKCRICGWTYDPEKGDVPKGIKPGTPFEKLNEDWTCYFCSADKKDFAPQTTRQNP